ncbi:MAG: class E sortase [Nocardioidaceae bacterium]
MARSRRATTYLVLSLLTLVGCSAASEGSEGAGARPSPVAASPAAPASSSPPASATPTSPPAKTPSRAEAAKPARPTTMSIPSIGVKGVRVVAYTGTADDLPGTRIQDRGHAATPRGPEGGVRPGQVGNYIITGHRTTHGAPFRDLPALQHGEQVLIAAGAKVYKYEVTRTLQVSFRSERSRMSQSAPVPGHPGKPATQAMITLSTCATPEDHAAGNFWQDELGNPEHRIDKIGVLVSVRDR